jgi:hypothetical protein
MKYVVILIVVVILVRIDVILRLFDKGAVKYQNRTEELKPGEIPPSSDLVPVENDLSFKVSPQKTFISMVTDFRSSPDINLKNRAIEVLRSQPTMFNEKLDPDLETAVYRWRDLLVQRNKIAHEFLMEMMKSLKGENLEMIRRFFSFAIDIDLGEFLNVYSKSTDINCIIMGYLGDTLPEEEKYNELAERLVALDSFLLVERPEPVKLYAQRCQMVLKLQVDKLKVIVAPNEPTDVPIAEGASDPAPISAPAPSIDPGSSP